ncbi:hypothetical protein VC83_04875 [Pseudogymnoascus destructans]|uniref:Uncharacterized protein n=2 Tax=Pseudogymnoascus destructans TaxID=655981 RepID=L8FY37_PSED2|nr:uncharacterized protein VC83_04875 [Pseudogymnoascus destructans]ELR05925.1 hypothetical protein GMDG_07698 [Pseudogymnoascus destructans 20631-21]OAF58457.1 hypothetical protein VC83_04875 [Pseudogymnoascus destructans]
MALNSGCGCGLDLLCDHMGHWHCLVETISWINNNGNGQGFLSAVVTDGLPEGFYRLCTVSSSANHQPVLMPVANVVLKMIAPSSRSRRVAMEATQTKVETAAMPTPEAMEEMETKEVTQMAMVGPLIQLPQLTPLL